MIKFFRKIRQKLLSEGKTGKYFKYAIGEIILVVIGILIALQINNWNENRKLKIEETQILENFKSSINRDLIYIKKAMNRYNDSKESINILIHYLQQDLPYKDSLSIHFGNINADWVLRIDRSVFEALKSKGFSLISNDSLKQDIINFYSFAEDGLEDTSLKYSAILESASENIYGRHFDALWEPVSREQQERYLDNNLDSEGIINKMTPRDFQALKLDHEFMYFLKSLRNRQFWLIRRPAKRIETELTSILSRIEKELSE